MTHQWFDVGGFGMGPIICRICSALFTGGGRWRSPGNRDEECPAQAGNRNTNGEDSIDGLHL